MTGLPPTAGTQRRRVLLAGATGLVGAEILRQLIDDHTVGRIVLIGRRQVATADSRVESHAISFDGLDRHPGLFDVDQVFCALGTTMKQAGSREAFRRVDHDYPLGMARLALAGGAQHFLLVSALGADASSRIFYNRVKGEVENALRSMPFRSVTIARPSLLLGERKEFRLMERLAMVVGEILPGRFRPVQASAVATSLVAAARVDAPGLNIMESSEIRAGVRR